MQKRLLALLAALTLCLGGCALQQEPTGSRPEPAGTGEVAQVGFAPTPAQCQAIAQGLREGWAGWESQFCPDLLGNRLPRVQFNDGSGPADCGPLPLLELPADLAGLPGYPAALALENHSRLSQFFACLADGTPDEIAIVQQSSPYPVKLLVYTFDGRQLWQTTIFTAVEEDALTLPDPLPEALPIQAAETETEWQFLLEGEVVNAYAKYGYLPQGFADDEELLAALLAEKGLEPGQGYALYDLGWEEYAGESCRLLGLKGPDGMDHGTACMVSESLGRCWIFSQVDGRAWLLARPCTAEEAARFSAGA